MNEIPATQNIGESLGIQTQEVIENAAEIELWGKLISLTSDPCFELRGKDEFVVGRNPLCDICFPENIISSYHCHICLDRSHSPSIVYIVDTSTNGTYVNGSRIQKSQRFALKHGDRLSLVFATVSAAPSLSKIHAFIFQDPTKPLHVTNSIVSQELDGFEDRYRMEGQLGKGNFGEVKLCREISTGDMYAAKIIDLRQVQHREDRLKTILREAELLSSLSHPSIPFVKEIIQGKKHLYIIMELVTGGDLFDRIVKLGRYNEVEARSLMQNILEVICYLHQKDIVHRDIKPENILLVYENNNTVIKVTDFGLAKSVADGLHTYCGTPQYYAPEILERRGLHGVQSSYGKAVDMWSLGVLLYVVLAGQLPFDTNSLSQQIMNAEVNYQSPVWKGISAEAKDLINKLIVVDPSKRLTVEQALRHPWIQNIEFSQLASQLASQLFSEEREESLSNLLCNENLSSAQHNAMTDSHIDSPSEVPNIIADSQAGEEDFLWKNRRHYNQWKSREVSRLIVDSSGDDANVAAVIPEAASLSDVLQTPVSKKPRVSSGSSSSSRQGTPFRSGLKAAVVASSVFDRLKVDEKREEASPRGKKGGKKAMVPSKNILSYFSPKKNDHYNCLIQTDHSSIPLSDCILMS